MKKTLIKKIFFLNFIIFNSLWKTHSVNTLKILLELQIQNNIEDTIKELLESIKNLDFPYYFTETIQKKITNIIGDPALLLKSKNLQNTNEIDILLKRYKGLVPEHKNIITFYMKFFKNLSTFIQKIKENTPWNLPNTSLLQNIGKIIFNLKKEMENYKSMGWEKETKSLLILLDNIMVTWQYKNLQLLKGEILNNLEKLVENKNNGNEILANIILRIHNDKNIFFRAEDSLELFLKSLEDLNNIVNIIHTNDKNDSSNTLLIKEAIMNFKKHLESNNSREWEKETKILWVFVDGLMENLDKEYLQLVKEEMPIKNKVNNSNVPNKDLKVFTKNIHNNTQFFFNWQEHLDVLKKLYSMEKLKNTKRNFYIRGDFLSAESINNKKQLIRMWEDQIQTYDHIYLNKEKKLLLEFIGRIWDKEKNLTVKYLPKDMIFNSKNTESFNFLLYLLFAFSSLNFMNKFMEMLVKTPSNRTLIGIPIH